MSSFSISVLFFPQHCSVIRSTVLWIGIFGGSCALKRVSKEERGDWLLLPDPLDFSKICAISKPSRGERRRMWTAGKKYSPPSFATDRPTRFKIDSTDNDVASEREQSQKNAFCSLIGEECPSSALFICQRNVLHLRIIVHSVSLCRVLCGE